MNYISISAGIILPAALLTWAGLVLIQRKINSKDTKPTIHYSVGCLLSSLLPILSLVLIVTGLSITGYDGNCYGFTDSVWGCSFTDFLAGELGWSLLLFSPALFIAGSAIAVAYLVAWLRNKNNKETIS